MEPACQVAAATVEALNPNFERPDGDCRLWLGLEPPSSRPFEPQLKKVCPNILEAIGLTPVVKLNKIPQSLGIECDVYVKCEFLNPGGSIKDRIGYRMVLDAEEAGLIVPGSTVIEPTSGNTGIGVALACAVRGYKCIIVMAEKNSNEKVDTLKVLGAEIIRTPTEAGFLHPDGIFAVSQRMRDNIPQSIILGQYSNPSNSLAHYDGTGSEIVWQFDGDVDMVVAGAGTGGTVSGMGKKLKEQVPKCKIVSFDPLGSILARPESLNESDVTYFDVEGIGYDFIPTVLKHEYVDEWFKTTDSESFPMARRLIREEGLLCGGSSGAAVSVAMKAAKTLKAGQKCVVLLPDGIRNYMTKFVSDNWMQVRGHLPLENKHNLTWWQDDVSQLGLPQPAPVVECTQTVRQVIQTLDEQNVDQLPVVAAGSAHFIGVAERKTILSKLCSGDTVIDGPIKNALQKKYQKVSAEDRLAQIACALENEPYVVVVEPLPGCKASQVGVKHLITRENLLKHIAAIPHAM